ncbi:MAG: Sugar nucleotidyl transferase, partial [Bacteroidota bacterium]
MNLVFFDPAQSSGLLPLTYTRPVAELRIGGLTISEKWNKR